jgi:2-polyprenyl-3-methyl-5-hydroxy-6-metoxy-1,4-benzoquinol methylase
MVRLASFDDAEIARLAAALYRDATPFRRFVQRWRSYICPFSPLARQVPAGSRLLDIGCGAGLFVLSLAAAGRIASAVGIDADRGALAAAAAAAGRLRELGDEPIGDLSFQFAPARALWPQERFDAVSMIDVMHHVAPSEQQAFFADAAGRVRDGGVLVYKDMCDSPAWRAWANRIHDLLLARQRIHYMPLEPVESWARQLGFQLVHRQLYSRLVYGHELLVFRRTRAYG